MGAISRAVLACALVISPAFGSYPKFKDYQAQNDVRAEARIDLDLDEILAKLVADDVAGAMTIYREGGSLVSLTPPTLQSISKPDTDNIMALDTWFPAYKAYWNQQINYADWFVETAAASTYQSATKKELIKKGIAYQGVWMRAVHSFDRATRECDLEYWDQGMAYYVGSLEGEYQMSGDYASTGNLLWNLAQKRCQDFGTCKTTTDPATIAGVNAKIQEEYAQQGKDLLYRSTPLCTDGGLATAFKGIVSQMTVPLVQGVLRYAWKADPSQSGGSCSADAGKAEDAVSEDCAKSWAEGWAFAAAVLPQVMKCDATAGTTIKDNLDIAASAPMAGGVAAVKTAIEATYACLGITCADVGAYQASGSVFTGMDACTFDVSTQTTGSTEAGGGTVAMTDAAARRAGATLAAAVVAAAVLA